MAKSNWIAKAVGKNPGGLHRTTGTPAGEKIPASKMKKAAAGGFGTRGKKQAGLARTLGGLRKK